MIELYFSRVKILAQRPIHVSAVATVLLITKTFTVTETRRASEKARGERRGNEEDALDEVLQRTGARAIVSQTNTGRFKGNVGGSV